MFMDMRNFLVLLFQPEVNSKEQFWSWNLVYNFIKVPSLKDEVTKFCSSCNQFSEYHLIAKLLNKELS
jgi:hypothetical protein